MNTIKSQLFGYHFPRHSLSHHNININWTPGVIAGVTIGVIAFLAIFITLFITGIRAAKNTTDTEVRIGRLLLHLFVWGNIPAVFLYVSKVNRNASDARMNQMQNQMNNQQYFQNQNNPQNFQNQNNPQNFQNQNNPKDDLNK